MKSGLSAFAANYLFHPLAQGFIDLFSSPSLKATLL